MSERVRQFGQCNSKPFLQYSSVRGQIALNIPPDITGTLPFLQTY